MPPEASSSARSASSACGGGGRSGLPRPRSISRGPGSTRAAAAAPTMRMKYCSGSAANRAGVGPLMPGILARYRRPMPRDMDDAEWRAFVSEGTRTGKLATTRHDGRPHVVPIWFVLDGDDFVFNTGAHSIKGRSLARNGIAVLCVDDERPPYAFVTVTGTVTITTERDDLRRWATAIGARYMGADRAEEFGERNAIEGELLVRLHADHVLAQADIAGSS